MRHSACLVFHTGLRPQVVFCTNLHISNRPDADRICITEPHRIDVIRKVLDSVFCGYVSSFVVFMPTAAASWAAASIYFNCLGTGVFVK